MIDEARELNLEFFRALKVFNISHTCYYRWKKSPDGSDGRVNNPNHTGFKHSYGTRLKLSDEEEQAIVAALLDPEHLTMSPKQLYSHMLYEHQQCIGSESTIYKVAKKHDISLSRKTEKAIHTTVPLPKGAKRNAKCVAEKPNDVWVWDISLLDSCFNNGKVYMLTVLDLYSRYVVHSSIELDQGANTAVTFMEQAIKNAQLTQEQLKKLIIHSDNGSAMRSEELTQFLQKQGVTLSFSRPRHSNDNPHIESFFGTIKGPYMLNVQSCSNIDDCNTVHMRAINEYNNRIHSALNVPPAIRYHGKEQNYLVESKQAYMVYYQNHPERFIKGQNRSFSPAGPQYLHVHEQMQHSVVAKALRSVARAENKKAKSKEK